MKLQMLLTISTTPPGDLNSKWWKVDWLKAYNLKLNFDQDCEVEVRARFLNWSLVEILKSNSDQDWCKKFRISVIWLESIKPWVNCAFGNVFVKELEDSIYFLLIVKERSNIKEPGLISMQRFVSLLLSNIDWFMLWNTIQFGALFFIPLCAWSLYLPAEKNYSQKWIQHKWKLK